MTTTLVVQVILINGNVCIEDLMVYNLVNMIKHDFKNPSVPCFYFTLVKVFTWHDKPRGRVWLNMTTNLVMTVMVLTIHRNVCMEDLMVHNHVTIGDLEKNLKKKFKKF